ncbi:hypothetical protein BGZ58_001025 [Dissophora ornata]|nr:hypothetical protein BGZ58_001025 [Dissophora ornata]
METNQDQNDAAYMSLLTRNIPGVGNTPLSSVTSKPDFNLLHITNKRAEALSTTSMSDKQRDAIKTLEKARNDAFFVSEGDEPFQTVHIIPTQSETVFISNPADPRPLPSEAEFLKLLKDAQIVDEDQDVADATCEKIFDLRAILNKSNPGADKIAKALHEVFDYDPSASATSEGNRKVALYRVTLPYSSTRVHLWVLGWVDLHLLGLHTISIES